MKKKLKLMILILLSFSVYFIYQETKNSNMKIMNIGEGLSQGINSYGIKDYSYVDYYKDYTQKQNQKIIINNTYSKKDITLEELLEKIKNDPKLKRDLRESHKLFINIGYNDLIYKMCLQERMNDSNFNIMMQEIKNDYNKLFKEIRKYYKNDIIVIGYYQSNKDEYYTNKGIRKINEILENNKEITYIDTYQLLSNRKKYFSNPNSYYPNSFGYDAIAKKIITKALDNSKKI